MWREGGGGVVSNSELNSHNIINGRPLIKYETAYFDGIHGIAAGLSGDPSGDVLGRTPR